MSQPMTTPTTPIHDEEECDVYVTVDARAIILDRFDGPGVTWLRARRGGHDASSSSRTSSASAAVSSPGPRPRWSGSAAE